MKQTNSLSRHHVVSMSSIIFCSRAQAAHEICIIHVGGLPLAGSPWDLVGDADFPIQRVREDPNHGRVRLRACVCVCVCVCERERARARVSERERKRCVWVYIQYEYI